MFYESKNVTSASSFLSFKGRNHEPPCWVLSFSRMWNRCCVRPSPSWWLCSKCVKGQGSDNLGGGILCVKCGHYLCGDASTSESLSSHSHPAIPRNSSDRRLLKWSGGNYVALVNIDCVRSTDTGSCPRRPRDASFSLHFLSCQQVAAYDHRAGIGYVAIT